MFALCRKRKSMTQGKTIILSPPLKIFFMNKKLYLFYFQFFPQSLHSSTFRHHPMFLCIPKWNIFIFNPSLPLVVYISILHNIDLFFWIIQEIVWMVKLTIVGRVEDGLPLAHDQTYINQQDNASFLFYKQQAELLLKQISKDSLLHPKMTILLDHHSFQYPFIFFHFSILLNLLSLIFQFTHY